MGWLISAGAELIGLLVAGAKWLANLRYLYKTSPEQVEQQKVEVKGDTISQRMKDRMERWRMKQEQRKKKKGG
jgi:hypothetical protein